MYYVHIPTTAALDPTEILTLESIQTWLRVDGTEKDFLTDLMSDGMQYVEDICDQPIFQREYQVVTTGFVQGRFRVLNMPKDAVVTATYTRKGSGQAFAVDVADIILTGNSLRYSSTLLSISDVTQVTLTVKLGYAPVDLPGSIRRALCYIVNFFYENRNDAPDSFKKSSERLLNKYICYGT